MKSNKPYSRYAAATRLSHLGRHPKEQHGFVNTPVTRGSTVVFSTLDELENGHQQYRYGRTGNPTNHGVEELVTDLEGAEDTRLTPSGLAAISTALLSVTSAGDEVLVTDSVYGPTRRFCDGVLKRFGVSTKYFDPRVGSGITKLVSEKTKAVFVESPGSLTLEMQDLPAIVGALGGDIAVIVDNSWATPLYHRPLGLGADIVVHAGTKMFSGHSDVMIGTVSANAKYMPALADTYLRLGQCVSPDDAYLTARGMRTLAVRMQAHGAASTALAEWLERQAGVARVIHPALPGHPDHAIFKRDFSGSGSLFSIVLQQGPREALAAMVDDFDLFGMGYSWGGFESLALPSNPAAIRTALPWEEDGHLVRLHIGLEDIDDLKADLSAGLGRYMARL